MPTSSALIFFFTHRYGFEEIINHYDYISLSLYILDNVIDTSTEKTPLPDKSTMSGITVVLAGIKAVLALVFLVVGVLFVTRMHYIYKLLSLKKNCSTEFCISIISL